MSSGILGTWDLYQNINQAVYVNNYDGPSIVTLNICNRTTTVALISVAISDSATNPDDSEWIEYNVRVGPNNVLLRTGVAISTGKYIVVKSNRSNVNAVVTGNTSGDEVETPLTITTNTGIAPIWTTAASLGAFAAGGLYETSVVATPGEVDQTITSYTLQSGTLPPGLTLSSDGTISGTVTGSGYYSGRPTDSYSFVIRARDSGNATSDRTFTATRVWADGSSSALAAQGPAQLSTLGITTNGVYWVNHGSGAYQTYMWLDGSSGGGYMLVAKIDTSQNDQWNYYGDYWTTASPVNESNLQNLNDNDAVGRGYYEYQMQTGFRMVLNSGGGTSLSNYLQESGKSGDVPRSFFTGSPLPSENDRIDFLTWIENAGTSRTNWDNQPYCNHAGFNVDGTDSDYGHRWGISMNNEADCASNDSSVGFGTFTNGQYTSGAGLRNANAGGARWNSDQRFAYKGFIFVR